jgi:hypothetical protein
MSKTPYEIRLDLLKLANEILLQPVFNRRSALEMEWSAKRDVNPAEPFPNMPDFPTSAQVIDEAERLNRFVSQS